MVKEGLGTDDEGGSQGEPQSKSPKESRRLSIQRCIQSLVHACQCRNASCSLPSCQKMKRVVGHTRDCKRKTNGSCPVCKQLIALCCYHGKHCRENKCPVPFCLNIKHKLRQQQIQHRLQQAQLMCRRMATMNTHNVTPVSQMAPVGLNVPRPSQVSGPVMPNLPPGQWQQVPIPQQQPMPGMPRPVMSTQAQPAIARPRMPSVEPRSVSPGVLRDLLRTLKLPRSPQQQQQVLNILKSNPQVMAAFIKQRTAKYVASHPGLQPQPGLQAQPGLQPQPGLQNLNAMQAGRPRPGVPPQQQAMGG